MEFLRFRWISSILLYFGWQKLNKNTTYASLARWRFQTLRGHYYVAAQPKGSWEGPAGRLQSLTERLRPRICALFDSRVTVSASKKSNTKNENGVVWSNGLGFAQDSQET